VRCCACLQGQKGRNNDGAADGANRAGERSYLQPLGLLELQLRRLDREGRNLERARMVRAKGARRMRDAPGLTRGDDAVPGGAGAAGQS